MPRIPEKTRDRARTMRHVPTDAERRLWSILRRRQIGGWYFRRQHSNPPYIADFACVEAMLVVEADGGQHADSAYDAARDRYLQLHGWRILRFWNNDVLRNPEGVARMACEDLGPSPTLPRLRRWRGLERPAYCNSARRAASSSATSASISSSSASPAITFSIL